MIRIQRQQMIEGQKRYIQNLEKALERLQEAVNKKDKDRLDNIYIVVSMVSLMKGSIEGWLKWCGIEQLYEIFGRDKDLDKTVNDMSKVVKKWIELDIKLTKIQNKKLKEEITTEVKTKKKTKKREKKKTSYVA